MFDPRHYWEERARHFGASPGGWKAVCYLGMPEIYNRLFHRLQKTALNRELKLDKNIVFLEFGCGVGRWLQKISHQVKAFHGLDVSPSMLYHAQNRLKDSGIKNAYLSQFDGCRIPYRNFSFDVTLIITVLIHIIESSQLDHVIKELCRVTKPGGRILVLESFAPKSIPSPSHVKFRPEAELIELFRNSGWGIQSSLSVYPFRPKERWIKTRSSRLLFRALNPWYYLINLAGRKLHITGKPPVDKMQVYYHE